MKRRLRSPQAVCARRHRDGERVSNGGTTAPAPAKAGTRVAQAVGGHAAEPHHRNPSLLGLSPCTGRDRSLPRVGKERAWQAQ